MAEKMKAEKKNKLNTNQRVVIKKYCKRCNKHTVHKETK